MRRLLLFLFCACALNIPVSAHVLDDYVQVAQIALSPGGAQVELRMTAGVEVADRVWAMIDTDGDGKISPTEEKAYAAHVLQDISLEADGRRVPLALTAVQFPTRLQMTEGVGVIHLDFAAEAAFGAVGEHQVFFRNNHIPDIGVYLANALIPSSDTIKITGQQRDELQHELRVNFNVPAVGVRAWSRWIVVLVVCVFLVLLLSQWKRLTSFFHHASVIPKETMS